MPTLGPRDDRRYPRLAAIPENISSRDSINRLLRWGNFRVGFRCCRAQRAPEAGTTIEVPSLFSLWATIYFRRLNARCEAVFGRLFIYAHFLASGGPQGGTLHSCGA